MYELIELTDGELDAVSGGNPFSINLSGLSASLNSSISATLTTAFTNTPVARAELIRATNTSLSLELA